MEKRTFTEIEVNESTNQGSYGYIESKALKFLEVGYQEYTKNDAFKQPGTKLSPGIIQMLTSGCEQIRDNKGLTSENPFEGMDIGGFYRLMQMFHFVPLQQKAEFRDDCIIDKITFEHQELGARWRIVLFNKVIRKSVKKSK